MCNIDPRRLNHTFSKHAQDFGVFGPWSNSNAALLEQAIRTHVQGPPVLKIPGTFRGVINVVHHLNPATDLWVAIDGANNFVAGWKLSSAQKGHLLTSGNVQ